MKLVVGLALIAGVLSAPTAPLTDRQVHIGAPAGVAGTSVGFGGSVGVGAHVGAGAGVGGGIGIREVSESKESANAPALETRQLHIGIPAGATGAGAGVGGSVGGSIGVGAHVGAGVGGGIGIREVSSESDDSASTANLEARQLHIGIPAGAVGAGVGVGGSASVGGHVGGGVGAGIGIREASQ